MCSDILTGVAGSGRCRHALRANGTCDNLRHTAHCSDAKLPSLTALVALAHRVTGDRVDLPDISELDGEVLLILVAAVTAPDIASPQATGNRFEWLNALRDNRPVALHVVRVHRVDTRVLLDGLRQKFDTSIHLGRTKPRAVDLLHTDDCGNAIS